MGDFVQFIHTCYIHCYNVEGMFYLTFVPSNILFLQFRCHNNTLKKEKPNIASADKVRDFQLCPSLCILRQARAETQSSRHHSPQPSQSLTPSPCNKHSHERTTCVDTINLELNQRMTVNTSTARMSCWE